MVKKIEKNLPQSKQLPKATGRLVRTIQERFGLGRWFKGEDIADVVASRATLVRIKKAFEAGAEVDGVRYVMESSFGRGYRLLLPDFRSKDDLTAEQELIWRGIWKANEEARLEEQGIDVEEVMLNLPVGSGVVLTDRDIARGMKKLMAISIARGGLIGEDGRRYLILWKKSLGYWLRDTLADNENEGKPKTTDERCREDAYNALVKAYLNRGVELSDLGIRIRFTLNEIMKYLPRVMTIRRLKASLDSLITQGLYDKTVEYDAEHGGYWSPELEEGIMKVREARVYSDLEAGKPRVRKKPRKSLSGR